MTVGTRSFLIALLSILFAGAASPSAYASGSAFQLDVHISQASPSPTTDTVDVDGSDSVENVKQKVQDHTGIQTPAMCLVFDGVALEEGHVLDDYGIQAGDTLELYNVPVVGTWSITPDEPYLGGTVSNVPITHPAPTHVSVSSGALPAGVALDANTGAVSGEFAEPGPFAVTLNVDTVCGSAALRWSGNVYSQLPDTGSTRTILTNSLAVALGLFLVTVGASMVALRQRVARN